MVPQISLTSLGGSASSQLQSMFAGKNAYWYAAGSLSEPIFDAGRLRSNYHFSQAQEQEMLLDYQKTILNALKDVSDSLVGYKETRERREQQAALVVSADAVRLARLRYSGGNTSHPRCSRRIQTCMTRNCNWRKARSRRRPRWCSCTPRWAAVGNSEGRLFLVGAARAMELRSAAAALYQGTTLQLAENSLDEGHGLQAAEKLMFCVRARL